MKTFPGSMDKKTITILRSIINDTQFKTYMLISLMGPTIGDSIEHQ